MGLPERINLRDKSILDLSISMSKRKKKSKEIKEEENITTIKRKFNPYLISYILF